MIKTGRKRRSKEAGQISKNRLPPKIRNLVVGAREKVKVIQGKVFNNRMEI